MALTPEEIEAIVLDEMSKSTDEDAAQAARDRIAENKDDGDLYGEARARRGY